MKNISNLQGCFWAALLIVFFSCNSNETLEYHDRQEISPIDSMDVKLPDSYNDINKWGYFYENDEVFLYEFFENSNTDLVVNVLDFKHNKYEPSLVFQREGPDGYNSSGVSPMIINRDSILIMGNDDKFLLYNSSAQKLAEYKYNSVDGQRFVSGVFNHIVFQDNRVLMPTINNTRWDDKYFYQKVMPVQYYSFVDQKFEEGVPYPEYLHGKFLWSNLYSTKLSKMNDSLSIVDFRFSDSIRIYNSKDQALETIYMGLNNELVLLDKVPSKLDEMKNLLTEKEYMYTMYQNGNLYRLASHLRKRSFKSNLSNFKSELPRVVTLIKYNMKTKEYDYYNMPITRYFLPSKDKLIVGSITSWEDENQDTWRRFYIYDLN
ncbi:hypothetical protein [Belliella pelovolcani]|uniref:hypothetical protein n=1 Tax=Belliella pelovolcani TaxID=529505 RepID=UPI00391B7F4A